MTLKINASYQTLSKVFKLSKDSRAYSERWLSKHLQMSCTNEKAD